MFSSIPANCDRDLVKEMFWYCVANNDTQALYKALQANSVDDLSKHLHTFISQCLGLYRRYHADSSFYIPFKDELAIASLIIQCIEDPSKFGL
jgi:hypothetical protein